MADKRAYVIVLLVFIVLIVFSRLAVEVADKSLGKSFMDPLILAMIGLTFGVTNMIKMHFILKLFLILVVLGSIYYLVIYFFDQANIKTKTRYFIAEKVDLICTVIGILIFCYSFGIYLVN